jgi:hypothetical protein
VNLPLVEALVRKKKRYREQAGTVTGKIARILAEQ